MADAPLTLEELRAPVIRRAAERLAVYATRPGEHLAPLGEAYSPHGDESVAEAQMLLKRDILAMLIVLNATLDLGLELDL